jgi:hypothetical protein
MAPKNFAIGLDHAQPTLDCVCVDSYLYCTQPCLEGSLVTARIGFSDANLKAMLRQENETTINNQAF